jgi:hypothetical protein
MLLITGASAAPKTILISLDGVIPRLINQYLARGILRDDFTANLPRYSSRPEISRPKEAISTLAAKDKRIRIHASARELPSSQGHSEPPADAIAPPRR